jgi:phosphatidylglycerophosphate synthase
VRDVYFAWLMMALFVGGFGGYAIRVLFHGRRRHERTEADGGSVLLRKPLMETAYWILEPVVGWVAKIGATPNAVSLFSLVPALGAGIALGYGWFALGAVLATVAQFADIIDGLLARKLGMASQAGEVVDSVVDRYVELFFLGGLAVHYRTSGILLVVLSAIGAAFMVSYSTAKGREMGVQAPRGAMRHAERGAYLLLGAALTPFATAFAGQGAALIVRELPMIAALVLVAAVGNVSAVRRFSAVTAALLNRQRRAGQPLAVAVAADHPADHRADSASLVRDSDTHVGAA